MKVFHDTPANELAATTRGTEFKATADYAKIIRPAMLDAFGKPEDSDAKVWPTVSAIIKALRALRKGTLDL